MTKIVSAFMFTAVLSVGWIAVAQIWPTGLDYVLMGPVHRQGPNCGDSTPALSFDTTAHTWGCQALSSGSGSPGGSVGQLQFNNTTFGGTTGFSYGNPGANQNQLSVSPGSAASVNVPTVAFYRIDGITPSMGIGRGPFNNDIAIHFGDWTGTHTILTYISDQVGVTIGPSAGNGSGAPFQERMRHQFFGTVSGNNTDFVLSIASGFGTGAALAASANHINGRIGVGTTPGATGTINFGHTFSTAPQCMAEDETTSLLRVA